MKGQPVKVVSASTFLFHVTLTTIAIVSLAIVITLFMGYRQPVPDRVAMLHLDMCKPPCWIGITPGVTKTDEAERRIKEVFLESEYAFSFREGEGKFQYVIQEPNGSQVFSVQISSLDSVVNRITLLAYSNPYKIPLLTAGELNAVWGSPLYIGIWSCDGFWRPYYNRAVDSYIFVRPLNFRALTPDMKIDWDDQVMSIQTFVDGQTLFNKGDYHYWKGYVSFRRYGYNESNFGARTWP